MQKGASTPKMFKEIEDPLLLSALNELGRSINIITTYGLHHPAVERATTATSEAIHALLANRKKLILGTFNGMLTIDEIPVKTSGTLLKSLERRLTRLHITGLRLSKNISEDEIKQLAELLTLNEVNDFEVGLSSAALSHISTERTQYKAVREGQAVANESDLEGRGDSGVLVLEDDGWKDDRGHPGRGDAQVEQIVAFLKGDIKLEGAASEELADLAKDPDRLGQMIMEATAIRQSTSEVVGESLGDIVLGCLRRTFDGLNKQPSLRTGDGVANLKKSLMLLEKSVLDKIHQITGGENPELDREIVQAIRDMDEQLNFEQAAYQYVGHQRAIAENRQQLQSYIQMCGTKTAEQILEGSGFPESDWKRIVVDSGHTSECAQPPIVDGINTLASVFEKLETLMKSDTADGHQVRDLLGQANENLDGTISSTREKLESLSRQIQENDTGTIGGQAQTMDRKELLSSIAEVAQELMQPLTAIKATIEMMLDGYVGEISSDQRDLLGLAGNSSEHLKFLMHELIDIVGCPANKGIDLRFHTTSEEVVLMRAK